MAACCTEAPVCALAAHSFGFVETFDQCSTEAPDGHAREVEVRLVSGVIAARLTLTGKETVDHVRRAVTGGFPAALLHGARLLDPRATFAELGVEHGASLTLVRRAFTWDGALSGRNAALEDDGRTARRAASYWHAVLVASQPARRFALRVLDNAGDWGGAVELGFTSAAPCDLPAELPATADRLPGSWVVDNTGDLRVDGLAASSPREAGWNARDLQPGDLVAVEATHCGTLRVEVNGKVVLEYAAAIPATEDLYPAVGLFGKTRAVELLDH